MAPETPDFEQWLEATDRQVALLPLVNALDIVAQRVREAFGANIWFAEIIGRRWSYIAGQVNETPSAAPVERVALHGDVGLVSNTLHMLPEPQQKHLVDFLRRLIEDKRN